MKRILFLLTLIVTTMTNCNAQYSTKTKETKGKVLVVYFSRAGGNYFGGSIKDIKVGNTEIVAKKIQTLTGGDIFKIEPVNAYPNDYTECTEVAQKELNADARPPYKGDVNDFSQYDVVYVGYPIWWGTMPMAVWTFLESHDFKGKTIRPFCTHEGSDLSSSTGDIRKLCPNATVLDGFSIKGSNVNAADKSIENWVNK